VGNNCHLVFSQKFLHNVSHMRSCVVMVKYSCSVPLIKFIDMYHNLVPRCYRGLGWSVYDLTEPDP
jgi:hypothetical protein